MSSRTLITSASRLRERDLAILDSLLQHHYLTRKQIQILHFTDPGSPRPAQRRLHRLRQDGLVLRRSLARTDGTREPEPYYCLTPDGAQVVAHRHLLPARDTRKRAADALAHPLYVRHALAAADLHCALIRTAYRNAGHCCLPEWWRGEADTQASFSDRGREAVVRPDGYVRYQAGDEIHHLLIEIDQATMRLPRLVEKLERYDAYHRSSAWRDRYPVFPKLLLLTTSLGRIEQLYRQLDRPPAFVLLATTHRDMQERGPHAAIWQQPGKPGPRPLLTSNR